MSCGFSFFAKNPSPRKNPETAPKKNKKAKGQNRELFPPPKKIPTIADMAMF